jgi:hypothetical protein
MMDLFIPYEILMYRLSWISNLHFSKLVFGYEAVTSAISEITISDAT